MQRSRDTGADVKLLAQLGLDPGQGVSVSLLHEKHGHRLFHVVTHHGDAFVLKLFSAGDTAEIQAYHLLRSLGIQTLPVRAVTDHALLLENVTHSTTWNLACAGDAQRADVGVAVAHWYGRLHAAGANYLARVEHRVDFLRQETDDLTMETIRQMAETFGLGPHPIWSLVADHLDRLRAAIRAVPETLLYNDFHWSNLAITRDPPTRAIMFDYHLLGIGPRVSDYRNVLSVLTGEAQKAFIDTYAPIDKRSLALDAPLATLQALIVASQLPRLRSWARSFIAGVESGDLEAQVHRAVELIRTVTSDV